MKLLFIGFGNVAKEMGRIFTEKAKYPKFALDVQVIGIFTARHGAIIKSDGIDLSCVLNNLEKLGSLEAPGAEKSQLSPLEAARTLDYDVLVELSALNIQERGEPAASHVRAALSRGKSVASANKGPVGFHYGELQELAKKNNALYLFESAVMDGAPVFNFVERCMKGAQITGFSGILNGTTNFILSYMENGGSFEDGVKKAQEAGIAEADPSMDVDGWDPAAKTAALANALMGAEITPLDVKRIGISEISPEKAREANGRGKKIKLICRGRMENGEVVASVLPEEVDAHDVMSMVSHFGAAIRIESDLMHPNIVVQEGPGLLDTAYGVIEDLITIDAQKR